MYGHETKENYVTPPSDACSGGVLKPCRIAAQQRTRREYLYCCYRSVVRGNHPRAPEQSAALSSRPSHLSASTFLSPSLWIHSSLVHLTVHTANPTVSALATTVSLFILFEDPNSIRYSTLDKQWAPLARCTTHH